MSADAPAAPPTRAAMGIGEVLPPEATEVGLEELRSDVRWTIREARDRRIYEIGCPIRSAPAFCVPHLAQRGNGPSGAGGRI
jgi:hypothetical protein